MSAPSARLATAHSCLLIARKDGRSTSRRQRRFASVADAEAAVGRWRKAGFDTWWLYGPRAADGQRPVLRQWTDQEN